MHAIARAVHPGGCLGRPRLTPTAAVGVATVAGAPMRIIRTVRRPACSGAATASPPPTAPRRLTGQSQRGARNPSSRPVSRAAAVPASAASAEPPLTPPGPTRASPTVVYKFGGSSVADASRMREVAAIVCGAAPEDLPLVVLSAMGKSTNLLLEAGDAALRSGPAAVPTLDALAAVAKLHRDTAADLGVPAATADEVEALLAELTQLLVGVAIVQELTPRARDALVSFGERLSTRLFAAYLGTRGVPAVQVDACGEGWVTTTDEFGAADVDYGATLPALGAACAPGAHPRGTVLVLTGFLGRGARTGAITTLGRGGSDLTAVLAGAALLAPDAGAVREVVVWKDVDGVLSGDPRLVGAASARTVPALTYDEATELAFFGAAVLHPLAMQPAMLAPPGAPGLAVRVKNSYNTSAPGTVIARTRPSAAAAAGGGGGGGGAGGDGAGGKAPPPYPAVSSIVLKDSVTLVDASSPRASGGVGFLAAVFGVFRDAGLSVDVVATSEVSVSITLDPARLWERDLVEAELDALKSALAASAGAASVSITRGVGCVSLICDVGRTAPILERAFRVLGGAGVPVLMVSQGASKTNISLIVGGEGAGARAAKALHKEFFG